MPDKQGYKSKTFRGYVEKILKKKFKSKSSREVVKDKIQDLLSKGGDPLLGNVFFLVLKLVDEDIDEACGFLFRNQKFSLLTALDETESNLARFLAPYTRSDQEIAEAAQIDSSRFNRVKNKALPDLYAFEVYKLAKTFELKPSQLFEYFYGKGPRPLVGSSG